MSSTPFTAEVGLDHFSTSPEFQYPKNTEMHFIFLPHTPNNYPKLIPYLNGEEVIACETASCTDKDFFEQYLAYVDAVLGGHDLPEEYGQIERFKKNELIPFLASAFRGTKKKIIPVDSYLHSGDKFHPTQLNIDMDEKYFSEEQVLEKAIKVAQSFYCRETITLGQLNDAASMRKEEGKKPDIAVVYGAAHRPLVHQARRLGACATEDFIMSDNPRDDLSNAVNTLASMLRWRVPVGSNPAEKYEVDITPKMKTYAKSIATIFGFVESLTDDDSTKSLGRTLNIYMTDISNKLTSEMPGEKFEAEHLLRRIDTILNRMNKGYVIDDEELQLLLKRIRNLRGK